MVSTDKAQSLDTVKTTIHITRQTLFYPQAIDEIVEASLAGNNGDLQTLFDRLLGKIPSAKLCLRHRSFP